MVNTFSPFGLQDLGRREGGSPQFGLTRVNISSTDPTPIFTGDPVAQLPTAPGSGLFGKYITQAASAAGTTFASSTNSPIAYEGVFRGCEYLNTAVGRVVWSAFWPGSAGAGVSSQADPIAYIDNDPSKYLVAQASTTATSSGFVPVWTSSMINYNVAVGSTGTGAVSSASGNTTTGQSGACVLSSISALSSTAALGSSAAFYGWRVIDFFSNYAPPGGFVNGTDNTNAGQILVLVPNPVQLFPTSSAGW